MAPVIVVFMRIWAHSRNVEGERHLLADHLRGTASLAREFAEPLGAGDLAYGAGLLHDAGKLFPEWQEYLLASEAGMKPKKVPHKETGACLYSLGKAAGFLSIMGHHGGIPDRYGGMVSEVRTRAREEEALELLFQELPEVKQLLDQDVYPEHWSGSKEAAEMRTRMLHSALVDADFLDTAAHFNASPVRMSRKADMSAMLTLFLQRRAKKLQDRRPSPLDAARECLFEEALEKAQLPPGIFRLNAPTGSGKTFTSAGFALAHAAKHSLRRVVVAVPFLSITDQNAAVYRQLLGDEFVLEQHSAVEFEKLARYGVTNWDATFIVTTTVQLFESLLSNKPSRTRKLHRLVNSVIVLDEIQAIPVRVLPVILDVLRILVDYFGATVLLSSATQPAWDTLRAWSCDHKVEITDVASSAAKLHARFARTTIEWVRYYTLDGLAADIAKEPNSLTIVNTVREAQELTKKAATVKDGTVLHLSTRLYPAHRKRVLDQIKAAQTRAESVTVISTQLVEAGVDLDFPVVFRAKAPAENIIQAQGRCNREGNGRGRVVVVDCPELHVLQDYRTSAALTESHFRDDPNGMSNPERVRQYYEAAFLNLGIDYEKSEAAEINSERSRLQFETVARRFRMIDDSSEAVVVGDAPEAAVLLDDLRQRLEQGHVPTSEDFRKLQEVSVSLPTRYLTSPYISEELPGIHVSRGGYDSLLGVLLETDMPHDSIW